MTRFSHVVLGLAFVWGTAGAAEVQSLLVQMPANDWLVSDRQEYVDASMSAANAAELNTRLSAKHPPGRRFTDAVKVNTVQLRPAEYTSISQRNIYYDYVGFLLETAPESSKLNEIRFFHAAYLVTSRLAIGAVGILDKWDGLLPIQKCVRLNEQARDLLKEINAKLFDKNMQIVRKLIYEWKEPRDPRLSNPKSSVSGWEFDLAMVEFEQANVEAVLKARNPSAQLRAQLRSVEDNCIFRISPILNINENVKPLLAAAKIITPDFNIEADRRAIGKAWVTILHRLDKQRPRGTSDYLEALGKK